MRLMSISSFLKENENKVFAWGEWDCVHFVARWIEYSGKSLFDSFDSWNYDNVASARKSYIHLLRSHDATSINDILDAHYTRCDHIPPKGSIVSRKSDNAFGFALGIVEGYRGIFVADGGYVKMPLDPLSDRYWKL